MLLGPYRRLLADRTVRGFVGFGLLGRTSMAMLSLGVILLVSATTGSYALAGFVAAAGVLGEAVGAPLVARYADRRGQRAALALAVPVHGAMLVVLVLLSSLRAGPDALLAVPAAVMGAAYPPIGAFVRARWSARLGRSPRLTTAYAFESVVDELIFVVGPVLATVLATRVHPAGALAVALLVTIVGGIGLSAQRGSEPEPRPRTGPRRSVLGHPAVRVVLAGNVAAGLGVGALDVSVVAFTTADGVRWASGAVLAMFALGSAAGGLAFGSISWRADPVRRLALAAATLAVGFAPLPFLPSVGWIVPFALLAGLSIAPYVICGNTLIETSVGADALTEALTWAQTGLLVGVAMGSWLAGRVADLTGGHGGFLVASPGVLLTALVCVAGWLVLRRSAARSG